MGAAWHATCRRKAALSRLSLPPLPSLQAILSQLGRTHSVLASSPAAFSELLAMMLVVATPKKANSCRHNSGWLHSIWQQGHGQRLNRREQAPGPWLPPVRCECAACAATKVEHHAQQPRWLQPSLRSSVLSAPAPQAHYVHSNPGTCSCTQ